MLENYHAQPPPVNYDHLFDPAYKGGSVEAANMSSREGRNRWLDAKLNDDPDRPLPEVSLRLVDRPRQTIAVEDEPVPQTGDPTVDTNPYDILAPDGRRLGFAVIKKPREIVDGRAYYYIGDIKILDSERGHGYGPAAYLAILKSLPEHTGLRTEGVLSDDAKRIWQRLEAKGVARPSDKGGSVTAYETVF